MIIRQLAIYSLPDDPTPLESIVIEALTNGHHRLHGQIQITVEDAFAVIIYASDQKALKNHQLKINTLTGVRNSISGTYNEPYILFRDDSSDKKFIFIYGPDLNRVPSTLSDDLHSLLKATNVKENIFNIERLEKLRVIVIRGGGLISMNESHKDMIQSIVCNESTKLVPVNLVNFSSGLHMYDRATLEHVGPDDLNVYMFGDENNGTRGAASNYLFVSASLQRGVFQTSSLPACHNVQFIDYWPLVLYVPEIGAFGNATDLYRQYAGVSFFACILSNQESQLSFIKSCLAKSQFSKLYAGYLGILHRALPNNYSVDQKFEDQIEDSKFLNYVQSYAGSINCAGLPLVQGFLRESLVFKNALPVTYTGSYCVSTMPAPHRELLTLDMLEAVNIENKSLYVYQVGFFNYGLVDGDLNHPLHAESGRQALQMRNALNTMSEIMRTSSIVAVIDEWHGGSKTTLLKLAKACGECGLVMPATALPVQTKNLLKKWNERHKSYNHQVILKSWLYVPSNVAFVVIMDDGRRIQRDKLELVFNAWKCPISLLGELNSNKDELAVFATNEYKQTVTLNFRRWIPKNHQRLYDEERCGSPPSACMAVMGDNLQMRDLGVLTEDTLMDVLRHPTVGSKQYLLHHVDRCGNGRIAQQPGVGPYDVPVSDYCIIVNNLVESLSSLEQSKAAVYWENEWSRLRVILPAMAAEKPDGKLSKENLQSAAFGNMPSREEVSFRESKRLANCTALGEQNVIFQYDPVQGARFAITESLLNLVMGPITSLSNVIVGVSVAWPRVLYFKRDMHGLFSEARKYCENMGVSFVIDTCHTNAGEGTYRSLVARASAPCEVPCRKLSPALQKNGSTLLHIAVIEEVTLMGTVYHEVTKQTMYQTATLEPDALQVLLNFVLELKREDLILSSHDISDGGIFACVAEMQIAGRRGVKLTLPPHIDPATFLLSETPGLILEVPPDKAFDIVSRAANIDVFCKIVGNVTAGDAMHILQGDATLFEFNLKKLSNNWKFFSNKQNLLFLKEGEDLPLEENYGNLEMRLLRPSYNLRAKVNPVSRVLVWTFPGSGRPEALLSSLTDSGFKVELFLASGWQFQNNSSLDTFPYFPEGDDGTLGIILYGTSNVTDQEAGDKSTLQWLQKNKHVINTLMQLMAKPWTFSLAIGQMACRIMLATGAVGRDSQTHKNTMLLNNASKRYESRWLNIHIPENTKAIALQELKGSILPCWTQGTQLGFTHERQEFLAELREDNLVATEFHNARVDDNSEVTYPMNPTNSEYPFAGICSPDGRHLALLHDPCMSYYSWQWQHVNLSPDQDPKKFVSPWKQMFYRLHLWALAQHAYRHLMTDDAEEDTGQTEQRTFPSNERRGAIGPDAQYLPRDVFNPY